MGTRGLRVLLTGGAGFIGSHVAEALLRGGANLAIVDNLDEFYSPDRKRANLDEIRDVGDFRFSDADICDREAMREVMLRSRPDVLIHLAARAGVGPSLSDPRLCEQVNVAGTLNLLELCREFNIPKFIFGSSSSVYGRRSHAPFSEDQMALYPTSPYAATKLSGELLSYTYAHLFAINVVCLRFFTVYGPRQRPDLAIHKFTALMEAGQPLPIYGDGSSGRDYTHVTDIVSGVLAALDYTPSDEQGVPCEVFNLGRSHPVKLNELVELLERTLGKKALRVFEPSHSADLPLTWANISKASQRMGYHPKISLEEGLQEFVDWYRSADLVRQAAAK